MPQLRLIACYLGASALAACLAFPSAAFADRPGTPNEEHAGQCNLKLTEAPMVCVSFNNTASEPVVFDIEFTVDGVKVDGAFDPTHPGPGQRPQAVNHDRPFNYPRSGCIGPGCVPRQHYENFSPQAVAAFNGHSAVVNSRTGDRNDAGMAIPPQGFRIIRLDYGVTYCFRFKARRVSDDMVSAVWSNWACATTDAPPPKPAAPPWVTTEYTPGGRDWRVNPPTVLVEWGRSANAGFYVVDRLLSASDERRPQSEPNSDIKEVGGHYQLLSDLGERDVADNERSPSLIYRVCAVNVSGYACTAHSTYTPPGDSVERSRFPAGDMTVPSQAGQETNRPVPTTAPSTEGERVNRRGGLGTEMSTPAPH